MLIPSTLLCTHIHTSALYPHKPCPLSYHKYIYIYVYTGRPKNSQRITRVTEVISRICVCVLCVRMCVCVCVYTPSVSKYYQFYLNMRNLFILHDYNVNETFMIESSEDLTAR